MKRAKIHRTKKRGRKKAWFATVVVLLLAIAAPFVLSGIVKLTAAPYILTAEQAAGFGADCILVLGAGVWEGDTPSPMLRDRLETGIDVYEAGGSSRLLMSGDHGREDYDEVNVMKAYAVSRGVPSEAVFMDHAGFSTYESMYRARDVFQAKKVLIVTQKYHLYRAVYTARALGLDACGVTADLRVYAAQEYYELREVLARCKDFVMAVFKPLPTYLGDAIPVSGNGDATND